MAAPLRSRTLVSAVIIGSLFLLAAAPVNAARIPERSFVPAGLTSVIHIRVDSGCGDAPTDGLEVSIPEGLSFVVPEAVPGWTVETEMVAASRESADADALGERVGLIRWSGGSLPDGQFMDFGLRALFPDEPETVLTFPTVQRCGSLERVYSGTDSDRPAPFVRIGESVTPRDLAGLVALVDELLADVESIQEQVADVRSPALRERVIDVESTSDRLSERVVDLRERLKAIEDILLIEVDPTPE